MEAFIFISKMKCETKFGINSTGNGVTKCTKCNFQNGNVSPRAFLADKDLDGIEGYLSFSHWPSKKYLLEVCLLSGNFAFCCSCLCSAKRSPKPTRQHKYFHISRKKK